MTAHLEPERELSLTVQQLIRESDGVVSVVLTDPDRAELPGWTPGAHVDLVAGGAGARQYSLSGDPLDSGSYRISVLREADGRGGSRWVHDQLRCGDQVTVRGPRNHFQLEAAGDYVFVAGGIGITPLLPMIRAVEATGKSWRLLYGGRSATSMAFVDELRSYDGHVELYDESSAGLIPLETISPGPDTLVYACGPERLLSACEALASRWQHRCLRVERFAARHDRAMADDHAFEVYLARTRATVQVPAELSILQVLQDKGLTMMSSCEEGLCGTCELRVLDGEIDHRDEVLTDDERESGEQIMICVSRAHGTRLTLDI